MISCPACGALRGAAPVTRTADWTIRSCLRRTEDVVARGVAQEDKQWDFAARVKAVTAVLHLEMAEQCRAKDEMLKDRDEENTRLSRIM